MRFIFDWNDFVNHSNFINEDLQIFESSEPTVNQKDPKLIEVKVKVNYAAREIIGVTPVFGKLLGMLKVIYTRQLPTAAVDGTHLFINPDFFFPLTLDEIKFILYHEIMHCAFLHFTRMGGRDAQRWNIAGDFEINWLVAHSGFKGITVDLVKKLKGMIDAKYQKMNAEQIYADPSLPVPKEEKPKPDEDDQNSDDSDDSGELNIGDIVYDEVNKVYGKVKSINRQVSPTEVEFDPISEEEAKKTLSK